MDRGEGGAREQRKMEGAAMATSATEANYGVDAGRESYELTFSASVDYHGGGGRARGSPALTCAVELHTYVVCPLSRRILGHRLLRCPYDICSAEISPATAANVAEAAAAVIAEQVRWQGLPLPDLGDLREYIRLHIVDGALGIPRWMRSRSCIDFQVAVHATVLRAAPPPDVMRLPRSPPPTDEEEAPGATAEDGGGDDDCAICLEKVAAGGGRCVLPCSHGFHRSCIARWLRVKADCPLCRAEIITVF